MNDVVDPKSPAPDAGDEAKTEEEIWKELESDEAKAADDDPAADDTQTDSSDSADPPKSEETDGTQIGEKDDPQDIDDADGKSETEKLKEQNERLEHQLSSANGRATGQQRRADRLQKQLDDINSREKNRDQEKEGREARHAQVEKVSEDYGDVINPLKEDMKDLHSRFDELDRSDAERKANIEADLQEIQQEEFGKFTAEHEDGFDVIKENQEVFRQWIDDQPKRVRDAFKVNEKSMVDGVSAAFVVTKFKAALAAADASEDPPEEDTTRQTRRDRQLDGARTSRSKRPQMGSADTPPDTDDEDALWDYWARQDAKKGA